MTGALKRLAGIAMLVSAAGGGAAAETPEAEKIAETNSAAASNVTFYEPAFFARFRPNTAMDMIRRIPGFAFDGGSGARGFSGTGGNVLIDGRRPPSRGDSLSAVISRIPADGVERIDVIRGGAEGIDMQGRPIIANVIRKPDAGVSGAVSANLGWDDRGGVFPYASLQMRRQAGGDLLEGSLELDHDDGGDDHRRWRVSPDGADLLVAEEGSDNSYNRIDAAGAWETNWFGGRLRLNGLAGVQTYESDSEEALVVPGGSHIRLDNSEEAEVEGGFRYSRDLSFGPQLEVIGFQSFDKREAEGVFNTPEFSSGSQSESTSGESIARATVRLPAAGEWVFDGGAETVFNFSETSRARSLDGQPFELDGDTNRVEELRAEAFGTATWSPTDNLSVESALRYEWSRIDALVGDKASEKALRYLKPRVNVSWSPADGHQWGMQIERVVEQLSFGSFASQAAFDEEVFGVGNPDIEPQKLWVFDARYERQFGGQNSVVMQYVHTEIEDLLGRTVIAPSFVEITRNTGTASRDALELDGTFELDRLGIAGGIVAFGVDLSDSSVSDPVTGEERRLSNQDVWDFNLSLQQTLADGNFRWSVSMDDNSDSTSWSPRSVEDGHGGPFVGVSVSWKPRPGWTLGAAANNLVAEDASFERVFYDDPRHVGQPLYTEYRTNESRRSFNISVRRDF